SEAELIKLKRSMADMSVSQFLRDLALDKEITSAGNPAELKKIRAELGKIGSNINQIAKAVNSGRKFDEERFAKMSHWLVQTLDELCLLNRPPAGAFGAWPILSRGRKKYHLKQPIFWRESRKIITCE